jgi:hypothetical protein
LISVGSAVQVCPGLPIVSLIAMSAEAIVDQTNIP